MNKFSYTTGLIILILIIGAGYLYTNKKSEAPTLITEEEKTAEINNTDSSNINGAEVNAEVNMDNKEIPKNIIVSYTKDGYSPTNIEVKLGDTVRWQSNDAPMWTASAKHPTHEIYPEFDQKSEGGVYEFTFTKAGEWKYHNHLSANHFGSVTVK